jgi:hypothetical protein
MDYSICNMYSSFECYKVVFTQVLGSSMAQQNMKNNIIKYLQMFKQTFLKMGWCTIVYSWDTRNGLNSLSL